MMETEVGRRCRACGRWQPITKFGLYRTGGDLRRNHCYDCATKMRAKWIAGMAPDQFARYLHSLEACARRHEARLKEQRKQVQRERNQYMRDLVMAMKARGMNQTQIAHRAGMNRKTIASIVKGEMKPRRAWHEEALSKLMREIIDHEERS